MPFIKILLVPELEGIITVHSTVGRLRKTIITHMLSLFNVVIDDDFVKLRTKWRRLIIVLAYSPGGIHPVFKCKESLAKNRL